jgi:hypothetical protein
MKATNALLAAASSQGGTGYTLRIILLVAILGMIFLGWFLLRGYGDNNKND